jgi:hypothetical protein
MSGVVSPAHPGLISYSSAMGDAATFIAPALLVAYVAVGGLLLLVSDVIKRRDARQTVSLKGLTPANWGPQPTKLELVYPHGFR